MEVTIQSMTSMDGYYQYVLEGLYMIQINCLLYAFDAASTPDVSDPSVSFQRTVPYPDGLHESRICW